MSRHLRIQYPGAIYHVTSRGNHRADIVTDDVDRGEFWQRIGETVNKYGWEMFAANLLTNHFHLFFRTPEPNLSRGMPFLLGGYARWWNCRHHRMGHVFQGRFRGHLVENETYFWTVSRYVHLNGVPVLVAHPAHWPWSTYSGYVDVQQRWDWVAYDALLACWQSAFGGHEGDPAADYRSFVEADLAQPCSSPFEQAIDGWILGSQAFADRIRAELQPPGRRKPAGQVRRAPLALPELVAAVTHHCGVSARLLAWRGSRHAARAALAYLAQRYTTATLHELATLLGLARADCVPNVVRRARDAAPTSNLRILIEQLERELRLT